MRIFDNLLPSSCGRKRTSLSLLTFLSVSAISWPSFADAPPGAYLESTNSSQSGSFAEKSEKSGSSGNSQNSEKYGRPLGDSLDKPTTWSSSSIEPPAQPNQSYQSSPSQQPPAQFQSQQYGQPNQNGWQGQPQTDQSGTYSGYAQQNAYSPAGNYSAPPSNYATPPQQAAGGQNWQADYPSLNDMNEMNGMNGMNGGGAPPGNNPQFGQATGGNPWQQPPPPSPAPSQPTTNTKTASTDDGGPSALATIANTVLPLATSVVTTAIMNKMMYGSMTPGYGGGYPSSGYGNYGNYNNPYGAMRNPMGGLGGLGGYGRPSLLNGIMGGGGGLLNNLHF